MKFSRASVISVLFPVFAQPAVASEASSVQEIAKPATGETEDVNQPIFDFNFDFDFFEKSMPSVARGARPFTE